MTTQRHPTTHALALITGASSGIGYELAKQFACNGYDVIMAADHQGKLIEAAQGVRASAWRSEEGARRVETVTCDLATREGVENLYRAAQAIGPVEVLCANAGIGVWGDFRETDLEAELRAIQLNAVSVVHLTKLMLRDMVARNSGKILITASTDSTTPDPFLVVYAATKAFVLSFAEGLREDLKDTGITVTALMPGPTETNFFRRAGMQRSRVASMKKSDPADVARAGYEALMRGDDHTVVGLMNKMQVAMGAIASDPMKAKMTAKMTGPKQK